MSGQTNPFHQHTVILATGPDGQLGYKNGLPWPMIREDMQHFNRLTKGRTRNAVVMGRKTWTSIGKPLPKRRNIVVSRDLDARAKYSIPESVVVVNSFVDAAEHMEDIDQCFVIGGSSMYNASLDSGWCVAVHHTIVTPKKQEDGQETGEEAEAGEEEMPADVWFKRVFKLPKCCHCETRLVETELYMLEFRFLDLSSIKGLPAFKREKDEDQYLHLVQRIIKTGVKRGDRTGVGTLSIFGAQMRFSLRNNTMPLLTTKNVFWRGVAKELLWFISGSTSAPALSRQGVKIWDANGSRSFLDGRGLETREEGDLGPVYGFQWRHFGAKYVDMHTDYTGQGTDQLANVIEQIRTNPNSRRIIMSAWNPLDLDAMALPPCHVMAQFYVQGGKLSCMLTQRSVDVSLGCPFNIASYALLTHMIAHCCDLEAEELVYSLGDAHVYLNHVEPMKQQLMRSGYAFPKIYIDAETRDIDEIGYGHLKLRGYAHGPAIAMDMAV